MAADISRQLVFLFNDRLVELERIPANQTVLQFLREDQRANGTKEGCAEGDCGACTVAVGEIQNGKLIYRSVNACIQFLGSLQHKHLITVEHLADDDGALHPVQEQMVAFHGSQCGFCTPGFIMSLFVHHTNQGRTERAALDDMLAGNLCRCTGYGPILSAAETAATQPIPAVWQHRFQEAAEILSKWQEEKARLDLGAPENRFIAPVDIDDLANLIEAEPEATLVAGATDVGLWVTKQRRKLNPLLYLGDVLELKEISVTDDHVFIGAGVTYETALPILSATFPHLDGLISRIGSRQIRNAGTIGGNIANGSPIGDTPPPLIALNTVLHLRRGQETRDVPLQDYFIDYGKQDRQAGEFVTGLTIPVAGRDNLRTYKVSKRFDQDITAILAAFLIDTEEGQITSARLCFGGMAGIPKRAHNTEQAMIGQNWSEQTFRMARARLLDDFQPLTDMRAGASYRMRVAQNLLLKYFHELDGGKPIRLDRRSDLDWAS